MSRLYTLGCFLTTVCSKYTRFPKILFTCFCDIAVLMVTDELKVL
uniref:Uncharacterized protein n=1 Tax=Anguilla anguilla TaxID=7936 RepID=A0A0E9VXD2_ANGAN